MSSCAPKRRVRAKPDAAIFLQALVAADIVGASCVGMRTALLSGREFSLNLGSDAAADHRPTYRISKLSEVVDLVLTHRAGTGEIDRVFHAAALEKRIRLLTR